jgi:hypothetical protein
MAAETDEVAKNKYVEPDATLFALFDHFNNEYLVALDHLLRGAGANVAGLTTYLSTPFGIMPGAGVLYVLDPAFHAKLVFVVDADNIRFIWPNVNEFAGLSETVMDRVTRLLLAGCTLNYVDARIVGKDSRLYWAVCPEWFTPGEHETPKHGHLASRKYSKRAADKKWTDEAYIAYSKAHAEAKAKLKSLIPTRGMLQVSTRAVDRNPGFPDPRFYGIHKAITITEDGVSIGQPFSVQMIREKHATLYKSPQTGLPLRAFVESVERMDAPEWARLHSDLEDEVSTMPSNKVETWRCAHCFLKDRTTVGSSQVNKPEWARKACILEYRPCTAVIPAHRQLNKPLCH